MRYSFRFLLSVFFILAVVSASLAQESSDSNSGGKKEKVKKGWNLGAVPVIGFDSDLGVQYGVLGNLYDYGDGTVYPRYRHSIYAEWSRTTKGSGINLLKYDSDRLIPGTRVFAEMAYLTEQALDFYGFNGAESVFNRDYISDESSSYISRMYYRHERELVKAKLDFQIPVVDKKLSIFTGTEFYGIKVATVDIEKLNKGKDEEDKLPSVQTLYDKYIDWNIISPDEKDGGNTLYLKCGFVYDTRDNEPNPMSGMWDEVVFLTSPKIKGVSDYTFVKMVITHRQYFTLIKDNLSFAYRLSYQPTLGGTIPFYMLPFVYSTNQTRDGVGGSKTARGILRNRLVGEDMAFGNMEFRWKFYRTVLFNQNLYFAINPFCDFGLITKPYSFNKSGIPDNVIVKSGKEKLHLSYGMGLRTAMNQNFIVAIDFGLAADKNDGGSGLYVGLNYLF